MVQAELGPERTATEQALAWLRDTFQIVGDESLNQAAAMLGAGKARYKELEAKRQELTRPLLAVKAGIDDLFKPVTSSLLLAEALLKGKIGAYHTAKEAERRAVMQASAAEYQAGGTPTAIIPEPAQVQGIAVRMVWDFEITDPAEVEIGFCSPDPSKIRDWLKRIDRDPPAALPGIRFFQREQVIARGLK
jgi:hypothetical protein